MANPNPQLPKFDAPPVVETVFGVHFERLPKFDVAQRALFWSCLRDNFPRLEEKAPVDEIREEFNDDGLTSGSQIRWEMSAAPPSPRLWAKSEDGHHTIQIQQDALLVNWERDQAVPTRYKPFKERRRDLAEKLAMLDKFLRETEIGDIQPTSCFARYINHIEYDRADQFSKLLESLLTTWRNETSDDWLPPVEQGNLLLTFAFPEQHGRLYVNVTPGVRRKDNKRILRMDLTARGVPREETIEAALEWIDYGHEWIVRGFTSLTRPEMHKKWRRTQ